MIPATGLKSTQSTSTKVLSLVSLILCLCTVTMWLRSYWYWDTYIRAQAGGTYWYLDSHQGGIWFGKRGDCPIDQRCAWSSTSTLRTNYSLNVPKTISAPDGTQWTQFFIHETGSFHAWSSDEPSVFFPSQLDAELSVPYWTIAPILAILPAISAYYILRQRRRARLGLCPNCGAEVHANVERCPECGIPRELKSDIAENSPNPR